MFTDRFSTTAIKKSPAAPRKLYAQGHDAKKQAIQRRNRCNQHVRPLRFRRVHATLGSSGHHNDTSILTEKPATRFAAVTAFVIPSALAIWLSFSITIWLKSYR